MQIKFNNHLPPGYLETQEADGVAWKSEQPVRGALDEHETAQTVKRFERDCHEEMERQRRKGTCKPISRIYTVGKIELEIIKYPWERIPNVLLSRRQRRKKEIGDDGSSIGNA